jgi:hypothetical protein
MRPGVSLAVKVVCPMSKMGWFIGFLAIGAVALGARFDRRRQLERARLARPEITRWEEARWEGEGGAVATEEGPMAAQTPGAAAVH